MKTSIPFNYILLALLLATVCTVGQSQSIVGKWQLMKETTCMEDEMTSDETSDELLADMKSMAGPTPQIVTFKQKGAGEESTRILNRRKKANQSNFYYRFTGEALLILDKKTQTLTEAFNVDKYTADSLILSSTSRPCNTKVFFKIKESR